MSGARVLLLAAGRGRRAGGPKAWREFEGKTLLEAHLAFFGGLLGADSISVSIQEEWRARCAGLSTRASWVAADPDAYPLHSLQRLIRSSPPRRSFVLHVDMPVFSPDVYVALLAANADAAVPVFNGKRGHPVLLSPKSLEEIARLDPARDRLDAWLRSRDVAEIPVATDAIFRNMNEAAA
jgi:molybdenum cofactor cytidylyltransferase